MRYSAEAQQLLASDSIREEFEQLRGRQVRRVREGLRAKATVPRPGFRRVSEWTPVAANFRSYVEAEGDLLDHLRRVLRAG